MLPFSERTLCRGARDSVFQVLWCHSIIGWARVRDFHDQNHLTILANASKGIPYSVKERRRITCRGTAHSARIYLQPGMDVISGIQKFTMTTLMGISTIKTYTLHWGPMMLLRVFNGIVDHSRMEVLLQ